MVLIMGCVRVCMCVCACNRVATRHNSLSAAKGRRRPTLRAALSPIGGLQALTACSKRIHD